MADLAPELLYDRPTDALTAAFAAAKAPLYGTARCHPNSDRMHGRSGIGWWTDPNKALVIAAGLRLTGYEVTLLHGYSTGVVILDPRPAENEPGPV